MRHIKDLMLSRDFFSRRPCQEILRRPLSWDSRLSACRGKDYLMVYDPNGREICLRDGALTEDFYQVSWFSPRTGRLLKEKLWERSDAAENRVCFQPPERGSRSDWVLLLDALPTGCLLYTSAYLLYEEIISLDWGIGDFIELFCRSSAYFHGNRRSIYCPVSGIS